MKICSKCKQPKELSEFGKCKVFKDGLTFDCRNCHNESRRKWAKENRKASNIITNKYIEAHPEFKLFTEAKRRAKLLNKPFSITRTDIIIPEFCPVLGIKLEKGIGHAIDSSPSLDCIIPHLGYVPGNIAVISHKANTIKSNASINDIKAVLNWLEKQNIKEITDGSSK